MRIHLDCGSGIAGDMVLGAMLDVGLSLKELESALRKAVGLSGWHLESKEVERLGWPARTFQVIGDRPFGSADKMKAVVRKSRLPETVRSRALAVLTTLAQAEAQAHRKKNPDFEPDGLGLLDTLVDVLGTSWALWRLGIEKVSATPVHTGRIAPATAAILRQYQIPFYTREAQAELATPTGVAILSQLKADFSGTPALTLAKSGYGAGSKDTPNRPNVLGLFEVQSLGLKAEIANDDVVLLETVMDDMDPRLYPHVADLLYQKGCLDVWWVSAGMKKGRPGIAFSVLCRPEQEAKVVALLFKETTTLGLRRLPMQRWILPRQEQGRYKVAALPGGGSKRQTEYEVVRREALRTAKPLRKLLK